MKVEITEKDRKEILGRLSELSSEAYDYWNADRNFDLKMLNIVDDTVKYIIDKLISEDKNDS